MADKPFGEMTDDELRIELATWIKHVENAPGWASAYVAARMLEAVVRIGNERGLGFVNPHPIRADTIDIAAQAAERQREG